MNLAIKELLEILKYPRQDIKICIETGTHRGDGSATFSRYFDKVYTIELSPELFGNALEKFQGTNVVALNGKSHEVLKTLIPTIKDKYLLFLDAHGSGGDTTFDPNIGRYGSPVLEELKSCTENPPEVVVIDDLCYFLTLDSYPKKDKIIEEISRLGKYTNRTINKYNGWLIFEKSYE